MVYSKVITTLINLDYQFLNFINHLGLTNVDL